MPNLNVLIPKNGFLTLVNVTLDFSKMLNHTIESYGFRLFSDYLFLDKGEIRASLEDTILLNK